jgi:hypothetical protein
MKIIINGETIKLIGGRVNYDEIIKASGMPYRADYSVTVNPPDHKAFILFPGTPDFEPQEGTRFNIAWTGAA